MARKVATIDDVVHIQCSKCNLMIPATLDQYKASRKGKFGLFPWCKKCEKARREGIKDEIKAYYQRNAEHFREYSATYRRENPEKFRLTKQNSYYKYRQKWIERKKKYHLENAEKEKQYRIANREKLTQQSKLYRASNPEKHRQSARFYRENNRDSFRAYQQKRTARKLNLIDTLTNDNWLECLSYFDNRDAYTGLEMVTPSQDHVIPVSKGGAYVKSNIVPCDIGINSSKRNRDLEEWYKKQPFFDENRLRRIYKWIGYDKATKLQQLSIL